MGLIGRQESPVPPNEPPEWVSTPNPNSFIDSVADNYDLSVHVFDQEDDDLTYSINAGSTALPSGITLNTDTGLLVADGTQVSGTTAGVIIDVKDADSGLVPSDSFSIVVNTGAVRAFPLAEGFGTETTHGRGGVVAQVTNLNNAGAGSLRAALEATGARIIIFRVSGDITLDSRIEFDVTQSDFAVFGQTAPGGGICIKAGAGLDDQLLRIGSLDATTVEGGPHDWLFQHIRFRHGGGDTNPGGNGDCVDVLSGCYNGVFDHCAFTWSTDETLTLWDQNADSGPHAIRDITVSHCIIGEGHQSHNTGTLLSGGSDANDVIYNISFHHNYMVHGGYRNIDIGTGSGDATKGVQAINNVSYDLYNSHHSLDQTQYTNKKTYFDCINDIFIRSDRNRASGRPVFNVNRFYTQNGSDNLYTPLAFDHGKVERNPPPDDPQDAGVWHPPSIYGTGNLQREVGLGTISTSIPKEADNELFVVLQYQGNTTGGGPYDGGETYEWRVSPFTTQPTNPVTTTTALQAYEDLITNGDVGALPHDSVDDRMIAAVTTGAVYNSNNHPANGGSYPTLTDTGAPTDTSGNGLPDSYQVGVLGKDIADAYNPANTFTVGNGYSDIENWIHTL